MGPERTNKEAHHSRITTHLGRWHYEALVGEKENKATPHRGKVARQGRCEEVLVASVDKAFAGKSQSLGRPGSPTLAYGN